VIIDIPHNLKHTAMPLYFHGKTHVLCCPHCKLRDMELSSIGYIHYTFAAIVKNGVRLSLNTPVESPDSIECLDGYIEVRRIGNSLTEEDFVIDLADCQYYEIYMEIEKFSPEPFIIFHPYKRESGLLGKSTKDLKCIMDKAVREEDYIIAAQARDELDRRLGKTKTVWK
jgi:hypothetical protein